MSRKNGRKPKVVPVVCVDCGTLWHYAQTPSHCPNCRSVRVHYKPRGRHCVYCCTDPGRVSL